MRTRLTDKELAELCNIILNTDAKYQSCRKMIMLANCEARLRRYEDLMDYHLANK